VSGADKSIVLEAPLAGEEVIDGVDDLHVRKLFLRQRAQLPQGNVRPATIYRIRNRK
jgi:hypothetical protein